MSEFSRLIAELPPDDYERLLSRVVKPKRDGGDGELPTIVLSPSERYEPFPLTDIQEAYWAGRNAAFELGNIATHSYMEFESRELDLDRFRDAFRRLIERHDMLRVVFLADGRQQVLERVPPYAIEVLDVRDVDATVAAAQLVAVRDRMSHQVLPTERWPLFEIRASLLSGGRTRLHISFDQLVCDASSHRILLRDLSRFYQDPTASSEPLEISFRDYVLAGRAFRESDAYRHASDYWQNRLHALPPAPDLPLAKSPASVTQPRFTRQHGELSAVRWQRLKTQGNRVGLTPSGMLLAAFAEVLSTWSASRHFTVNLTLFNRLPVHPQIDEVVGEFTSLTLLEIDLTPREAFEARAQRIQQQLWSDLDGRYVSGVQVRRELALARGRPQSNMPVVFTSVLEQRASRGDDLFQISALGRTVFNISQTPQVWLDHQVAERDGTLTFNWDAIAELFPAGMLEDMFQAYSGLLERLADRPHTWAEADLQLLPDDQRARRARMNATDAAIADGDLSGLVESRVRRQPHRTAVIAGGERLTYGELAHRSRDLARRLHQAGVRSNQLVAVVVEKGWEQVVAVLGVVQAGAAYLPIEPGVPAERLQHLLDHGRVAVVVTTRSCERRLRCAPGPTLVYVEEHVDAGTEFQLPSVDPDDLAYVIYTSGSTGQPKGVMIQHRAVVNTLADINNRFGIGPDDAVLALSSIGFDLSVYDIFGALAAGATIVVPDPARARDPRHWADIIEQAGVTIWNSVPALMDLLLDELKGRGRTLSASVRLVLLSGDWIPLSLARQLRADRPNLQLVSLGGATEASIWSIYYPIGDMHEAWTSIPYGRPLTNQQWHVLDADLGPCPDWVPGDLYIVGRGLAQGYWRDPDQTAASFRKHPKTGERLYRTGDRGRYLPSGDIEFLGRQDLQVKIHGHRVELAEIEAILGRHPAVSACLVDAIGDARESRRLAAYVVGRGDERCPIADIQGFLERKLPAYMVPSQYVWIRELPLTQNGKVDRKRLPIPSADVDAPAHRGSGAGSSATRAIGDIVAGILQMPAIDPEADLLALGANSVDIIRIANALDRELGFRPNVDEAYRTPRIAALAEAYERSRTASTERASRSAAPIVAPDERRAFKARHRGIRSDADATTFVPLRDEKWDGGKYAEWRTHRTFRSEPIALGDFSRFIGCLRQTDVTGGSKYLYGSAGGLYPVQVYLHVKAGRLEQVCGGTYYYHPVNHRLVALCRDVELDATIHDRFVNRPIYEHAAFSLYLIVDLDAIEPLYGEHAIPFATLEAGAVSQLLRMAAPDSQLGLCAIGNLNFAKVRNLFKLTDRHVLLHSLVGGGIDQHSASVPFDESGRVPSSTDAFEDGEL